jgi:hypothetical protein
VAAPSTGDFSGSVELDCVFQTPRDIVIRTRVWNPAPGLRPPGKRTSVGVVIDRTPYPIRFEAIAGPLPGARPVTTPTVPVPVHRFLEVNPIEGRAGYDVVQDYLDRERVFKSVNYLFNLFPERPGKTDAFKDVDFREQMVLVCHGSLPCEEDGVAVHEVVKSDREILVRLREWGPARAGMNPFRYYTLAFVIGQSDLPVRFE